MTHPPPKSAHVVGAATLALVVITGCAAGGEPTTATTTTTPVAAAASAPAAHPTPAPTLPSGSGVPPAPASPTPAAPGTQEIKVYFPLYQHSDESPPVLIPVQRTVERTPAVGKAAMNVLLAGPTLQEGAHDLQLGTIGTTIPEGTRLLDLDINDGRATVDLSSAFTAGGIADADIESWAFRLAQVTYTLTQFPTIEEVEFRVEGRPIKAIEGHEGSPIAAATRSAYFDQLPGVFIDSPAWGTAVDDTFVVTGIAQVVTYPSRFELGLVDGKTAEIITQQTVRAACNADCWLPPGGGAFELQVTVPPGADRSDLRLRVWELAPDEGGVVNWLEYPLR